VLRIGAGGLDIDDRGDELRVVVGWVIFDARIQSTNDAVVAALGQRVSHPFESGVHHSDIDGAGRLFNALVETVDLGGR
jgi:hypothetical protein